MKLTLPQPYFSRLCRAIIEFDMIQPGDRILIGLSGGKDSVFLTYALAVLKQYSKTPFELAAITLDARFSDTFPLDELKAFCARLDIPFYTEQVDIAGIIAANDGKDPCFTCSFFRRGAINRFAMTHNFNKIAYAHHHDDAVETFYMNLMQSGQLKTFLPTTYLSRSELTVIRPLIYFREYEMRAATAIHGFTPIPSPCPLDGHTKRQEVKETLLALEEANPGTYAHLAAAMRQSAVIELWPEEPDRKSMQKKHLAFWQPPTNSPV